MFDFQHGSYKRLCICLIWYKKKMKFTEIKNKKKTFLKFYDVIFLFTKLIFAF